MRPDEEFAGRLLRAADPRPAPGLSPAERERAERDLQAILSGARRPPAIAARPVLVVHRRRAALVLAGAAAAVAVVAAALFGLPWVGPSRAYAVTPPPLRFQSVAGASAPALLRELAHVAGRLPAAGSGPVDHLVLHSWSLTTSFDGKDPRTASAVEPVHTEVWRTPDGSGLMLRRRDAPEFLDEASRGAWAEQGLATTGGGTQESRLATGSRMWPDAPPTDTAALARWLRLGHPPVNGPYETLVAVADLARERALTPAVSAAVLRVLADVPGLTVQGATRDRLGRQGIGFSLLSSGSGLPTRYTLIFSFDGRLLGFEQMLTQRADWLRVKVPAVIAFDAFAVSERVPAVPGIR